MKKLTDLSEEQQQKIAYLYVGKEMAPKSIIKKFELDVHPTWLTRELSLIRTFDVCEKCGEFMYKKLEAKTSIGGECESECRNCGNKRIGDWKFPQEFEEQEKQEKRNLIEAHYGRRPTLIRFEDLDMEKMIQVLFCVCHKSRVGDEGVILLNSKEVRDEWVSDLVDQRIISVSPKSPIEAFIDDDFPEAYYINHVFYDFNVFCGYETVQEINANSFFFKHYDLESIAEYLRRLLAENFCDDVEVFMKERKIDYNASLLTEYKLVDVVAEVEYTKFIALRDAMFSTIPSKIFLQHRYALNTLLRACKMKTREQNTVSREVSVDSLYISNELNFFVSRVIGQGLDILKEPITLDNMKKWKKQVLDNEGEAGEDNDGWRAFIRANDARGISRQEIIADIMKFSNVSENEAKYLYNKHVDVGTLFKREEE